MSQYFENDKNLKSEERQIDIYIKEEKLTFIVDHGIFSKKGLDFGTRSLLESIPVSLIKGDVLDFGCGYGPIGIYLAKQTKANIDMVDINKRALHLATKNALQNKVQVNVFESNIYENIDKKYDYIVTNPPIRVGKETLYKILLGAKEHLKKDGIMYFVIHKDQGAKSTMKDLEKEYIVNLLCKNKGFYIIAAKMN
ncbi:MAG: methyltransferase [Bacilli bacterium]|nr:methyltransferase [Bacilli bacterium]